MKKIVLLVGMFFLLLAAISCSPPKAVATADAAAIAQAIDSGWLFTATYVMPQSGRARQPNGVYTVRYTPNELNVYLPYFGKSYGGADVYNSDGPLDFISKDFALEKQRAKQDSWRMVFKPAGQQIQSMSFEIFDNGAANLDVIFNNRSPISFRGVISLKPSGG